MKDLRLLQTKKSPRKEMTSLYQRMLTFMATNTIFDTGCIGLQSCIEMQPTDKLEFDL